MITLLVIYWAVAGTSMLSLLDDGHLDIMRVLFAYIFGGVIMPVVAISAFAYLSKR